MVITDPGKRPSERFIEILSAYFLPLGYTLKKSSHQFVRKTEDKTEILTTFFYKTASLVSVSFAFGVFFEELEKIYKTIAGEKIADKISLRTDLLNYSWRHLDKNFTAFELYDGSKLNYNDISLNNAANQLVGSFKKIISPFFEHYNNLNTLEAELNRIPIKYHSFIGYGGRQVVLGLYLGKKFHPEKFSVLTEAYQYFIESDTDDEDFKTEMRNLYNLAIHYLDNKMEQSG